MKGRFVLTLLLVVFLVAPVFAQESRYEASVGYSFLSEEFETNRHGWVASFAKNFKDRWAIKAEAGGNYAKSNAFGPTVNNFEHAILAGPRLAFTKHSKLAPWVAFLVGSAVSTGHFSDGAIPTTFLRFAIQPGVGIDYWLKPKFGIRVGSDYRRLVGNFSDQEFFRAQFGIVVRFGGGRD